ncbi:MAG: xanthine dehydrogenase accessory protein XdhC [Sneathiellaceae bacterium]
MTEAELLAFLARGPALRVTVAEAAGSTPRAAGTWMLVGRDAVLGTIGGGQLELLAIDEGRKRLAGGAGPAALSVALGPEICQCCGGRVGLRFDRVDDGLAADLAGEIRDGLAARPAIFLFGAGHVGRAMAAALALLPVRTVVSDTRPAELARVEAAVETRLAALPEALVDAAPPRSAFLVLTHDHALDFLIAARALGRSDAAYIGMIGSRTKRQAFEHWLERTTGSREPARRLHCPIAAGSPGDKRPEVIAGFAAAEVLAALLTPPADGTATREASDVRSAD